MDGKESEAREQGRICRRRRIAYRRSCDGCRELVQRSVLPGCGAGRAGATVRRNRCAEGYDDNPSHRRGRLFRHQGVDHIAKPGCLSRIIGGSYPSGPTKAEPPKIWQMITAGQVKAYNIPSGIVFDMLREAAAQAPWCPHQGRHGYVRRSLIIEACAMNDSPQGTSRSSRRGKSFDGEDWLYFPAMRA